MKSGLINTDAQLGEEYKHTRTVDLILMQPHTRMNTHMQKHTEWERWSGLLVWCTI